MPENKCFHRELRRARNEDDDGYADTWFCTEPGCQFESNRSDESLLVRVCTAYEQGFGQTGRGLTNPYGLSTPEAEAWNIGWQEGKKRLIETRCLHPVLRDSTEQPGVDVYVCDRCNTEVRLIQYEQRPTVRRPA
jgi:hypothetical protein